MTEESREVNRKAESDLKAIKTAICLFVLAVLLVVAGTAYAVVSGNSNADKIQQAQADNNRAWCDALGVLVAKPVPSPANPKANPSREQGYQLYVDFVKIRKRFDC